MATIYQTLTLNVPDPGYDTQLQNVNYGDTLIITLESSTGFWDVATYSGCTISPQSGTNNSSTTVTFPPSVANYSITFESMTPGGDYIGVTILGSIAGTGDSTPDQFTFVDQTGVNLSTNITSAPVTITGLTVGSAISVSAGSFYDIDLTGNFTGSQGTVSNGQQVRVRHLSSGSFNTQTSTILTIGGVQDTFTSTTRGPDVTPNQFTFSDVSNAIPSTSYSSQITVTGLEANYPITITSSGGFIDAGTNSLSGNYATSKNVTTSASGTIILSALATSSGSYNVSVDCIVTIGSISDTFRITTGAAPTYSVSNASTNEGASATANVTTTNVANGTTLYWTVNATTADVSTTSGSFSIDSNAGSFSIPAIADSLTEGTETYTISVRTGSTAGTVVATSTLTINDTSQTPVATYSVANASTNEGASATVNVTTTNVANGTTLYWTVGATTADVSPTSGSFTVNSNAGSFTIFAIADSTTEGSEGYTISVKTGSTAGTIVAQSTLTINDTSTTPSPTYFISPLATSVNEGDTIQWQIDTTFLTSGTLYWTNSGTTSAADFTNNANSGSITITDNSGTLTKILSADSTTEVVETIIIQLRTGSTSGPIVAVSETVTVNDTSTTPATYSVANASTNEGASATVNVTTTNVSNGTTLYWTVDATTSDVSTTSGSFSIFSNSGSFTIPAIADLLTEGTEYYTISVRTGSTGGTVVASSVLTINDTSQTPVANDTTPDAFGFTSQTGVPLSTLTSSNVITITGINTDTSISVSSGSSYSINGGSYTSASGTITNGQTVSVQHTSSSSNNASTTTTLTIGGVQGTFTSTTTGVILSTYGLRIYDQSGNITLDTIDETMKDLGIFSIGSVTANQSILGVPVTANSIALVNNNNGDGDNAIASAIVSLNISTSSVTVSGGAAGFNISIRVMEF